MAALILVRPPVTSTAKAPEGLSPPSVEFLTGTWHVTHSTLPMWKKSRNVKITYKPLSTANGPARIADNVSHQLLSNGKVKDINGVDTAEDGGWGYKWRGNGLMKLITSKWEVVAYGKEEGTDNDYAVTFFNKTMFTPTGIDFYSKGPQGLKAETVEALKKALSEIDDVAFKKLASEVFEVKMDGAEGVAAQPSA